MYRRSWILVFLLLALALPMPAPQFIELPFDQVAREAKHIVRGTVIDTFSTWDDAREVIYTYATHERRPSRSTAPSTSGR